MKRLAMFFTIMIVVAAAASAKESAKPVIYTPSSIKWMAGTGNMKGLQVAALDGNPSMAGPFTVRLLLPAGTKFPVHYHDDTERVTVISGSLWVAFGTKYDAAKLMPLPAGSFCIIPAGLRHFAATKVDTVIQLSGNGPFGMKMDKANHM